MKIREININSQVFLAPMAGYTDFPFRIICKEMGAAVVYSEFVSSEGLIRKSEKTEFYLVNDESERPFGIQIFGHNPDSMAESAKYIEEKFHPDIIDINFGCSVRKVVKKNAGSALLKDLPRLKAIAEKVVKAVDTPVTGKIRIGWTHDDYVSETVGKILEKAGIEAITVHGRTASDGFGNRVQLDHIRKIKESVQIPVIGNGDILTPQDAKNMLETTGCDAVMVGRGTIGNPWLIKNILHYLKGEKLFEPQLSDRVEMCIHHLNLEVEHRGAEQANKIMRKIFGGYFKGFAGAAKLRHQLVNSKEINQTLNILKKFQQEVS